MVNSTFENTTGILFISTLITMGLWGAGTIQLFFYYNNCATDRKFLKIYVFTIWLLDTVHQIVLDIDVYLTFVRNYGNFEYLANPSPYTPWISFFGSLVATMVQSVFVWKIWKLSERRIPLVMAISILVLAQFALQLAYCALDWQTRVYDMKHLINIARAIHSTTVASNCMITGSIVWLLLKSRTGFRRSDTIINRLVLFIIGSGSLISISAILTLATSLAYPDTFIYILFFLNIARLYVNSLLALLNYRKTLGSALSNPSEPSGSSFGMTPIRARRFNLSLDSYIKRPVNKPRTVNINVVTETVEDRLDKEMQMKRDGHGRGDSDSELGVAVKSKGRVECESQKSPL